MMMMVIRRRQLLTRHLRTTTRLARFATRCSSSSATTSTSTSTSMDITSESDFAFRKVSITSLNPQEQDDRYYPTLSKISDPTFQTTRVPDFRIKYQDYFIENTDIKTITDSIHNLNGKVKSIRRSGKGSIFIDIIQDYSKVQILANHKMMNLTKDEFYELHINLKPGDQISCFGNPGITKVGELTLKCTKPIQLASPSLHPLPPKFTDSSKIYSNRVVNYLVNKKSQDVIIIRSKVISIIRRFLEDRDFLEVSTPIIGSGNTGANATPFTTTSTHIKDKENKPLELSLRVAPELWLKKLIISGFDKIFEIGKVFRNEGIDSTHNPEFTTCEFYQTFIDLECLMQMTEDLLIDILKTLSTDPRYSSVCYEHCSKLLQEIESNGNKFKKIDFIKELEIQTGIPLPSDLNSNNLIQYYNDLNIPLPIVKSSSQLLDNLSSIYLEPQCQELPTFIYNLPEVLSPLAKSTTISNTNHIVSNRFELYINGKELVNAYEEENNPFKQHNKFQQQLSSKLDFNDKETIIPDYKFIEFMEWGMPPTGGWGLGIDRLVMLVTGTDRIDNVLSFGKLSDVLKQ
ncbi:hypothetical protein CANARDRAFT_29642 [[Candida] arabinofermentans NRRL YB-2248]|uniref:Lysyl-tRNA synthetase n=1 Tax=[Candida] arabinofermentans NRRL YB-2248 TaxID=983967 RepID=A0A1E4SWP6_9ASCO|nr:hypothetical protein CANARDRAFT_29642 [[Candida] arabinofermentans NRRL YB-2248]